MVNKMPYIFKNEVFTQFMFLDKEKLSESGEVVLTFNDIRTSKQVTFNLPYDTKIDKNCLYIRGGKDLYKLAARHIIMDCDSEKNLTKEKEISLKYEVLSSQTAYIAIEKNKDLIGELKMEERKVPVVVHENKDAAIPSYITNQIGPSKQNYRTRMISGNICYIGGPITLKGANNHFHKTNQSCCGGGLSGSHSQNNRINRSEEFRQQDASLPLNSYQELLISQSVDGSWRPENLKNVDALLTKLFEKSPGRLLDELKNKDELKATWLTIVVLVYLERKKSDLESEWKLIARKARTYLKNQGIDYESYKPLVVF